MTLRLGLGIALAVLAGVVAWVGKRRFLKRLDEPLYTDRFYAHRMTMVRIYTAIFVANAVLAPRAGVWLHCLTVLSIMAGGFPSRRVIFGETWTFLEYLAQRIRLSVFAGGPWLALMTAPAMLERTGVRWAPVIFLVVLSLYIAQQRLLLFGLASTPLQSQDLLARFDAVLAKADAPRPVVFEGGRAEGRFLNAFALPAGKRSRIVMTRALLRILTPEESTAIFAHETAHLEHYAKPSMRRRMVIGSVVVPFVAVAPQAWVLVASPNTPAALWIAALWPVCFVIAIAAALTNRQKHETGADLRALQLGADPNALIGGLEKIHQYNGMPRRLDAAREARMSHPSLARRIQAIRRAAGFETTADASLPRTVAGRQPDTFITFTNEAMEAAGVSYRYDAMQSLITRQTMSGWELFGRSGRQRIRLTIATDAVVEAQTILDSIDGRLAHAPAQQPRRMNVRLVAAVLLLMSLLPGISGVAVFASIVALISASAAAVAALGAIAIAAGLGVFAQPTMPFLDDVMPALAAVEILFGIICLTLIRHIPAAERARHVRGVVIALGVITALILLPSVLSIRGDHFLAQIFLIARGRPSVAILLIGIGAALAVAGRRRYALAHVTAAVLLFAAGTQMFGAIAGGDPLLSMREPAWVTPSAPSAARNLEGFPTQLRLASNGRAFAVASSEQDPDMLLKTRFMVGTMESPLVEVKASDLQFLSDGRVVTLDNTTEPMEIALRTAANASPEWTQKVPRLFSPELTVEPNGAWTITGRNIGDHTTTQVSGRVGSPGHSSSQQNHVYASIPVLDRRDRSMWAMMLSQLAGGTEFWRAEGSRRERVGSTVLSGGQALRFPGGSKWAVVANDNRTTYAGVLNGSHTPIRSAGAVGERAYRVKAGAGSRIAMHSPQSAYVWNLESGKAMRIRCDDCMVLDVALSDNELGVLVSRGSGMLLEMYSTRSLQ